VPGRFEFGAKVALHLLMGRIGPTLPSIAEGQQQTNGKLAMNNELGSAESPERNAENGAGGAEPREESEQRGKGYSPLELAEVKPWPEPVDLKALLDKLVMMLKLFVVLPQWAAETLALWVVHTYSFELRDVTAYIGLESPEHRCGKSTLATCTE